MLDKIIQSRRSIKKFKSTKPDWRDIIDSIDSMRYAPMAGNNFSLKIILVDDKKKIAEIAEASQQPFISSAHYVVVVCSDPKRTKQLYEERAEKYLRQQAGAAIQNFLLKITEKGLATCWIGHFIDEEIKILLKIPENFEVEALFPIGYEYKKHPAKRKMELTKIMSYNNYKITRMNPPTRMQD